MKAKYALRGIALGYLALLVAFPVGLLLWRTFEGGIGPVWEAVTAPAFANALWLTVVIAAITVPLNTVFGVLRR